MNLHTFLLLCLFATGCNAEPQVKPTEIDKQSLEKKKVCIRVYDAKLSKEVEKCRTLTIHKKYDGKIVPK